MAAQFRIAVLQQIYRGNLLHILKIVNGGLVRCTLLSFQPQVKRVDDSVGRGGEWGRNELEKQAEEEDEVD
jgi:hypothetical protein